MSEIEFCPECEAPVVGFGTDIRCTNCGMTYAEMIDNIDDDFLVILDDGPEDND